MQTVGYVSGHMTHVEDLLFELGVDGCRIAIEMFSKMLRELSESSTISIGKRKIGRPMTASLKMDGAPAIFCGIDKETNRFFIAKKSIFNKTPKLYFTEQDIDSDTSGDLSYKLKIALKYCSQLGIKTPGVVYQGDILFTKDMLKIETIDGESYVTFHPNTIVYAVPMSNETLAKKILNSDIGIVWHTIYRGESLQEMKPMFGVSVLREFGHIPTKAWMIDAAIQDLTSKIKFDRHQEKIIYEKLSSAGRLFRSIDANILRSISNDEFVRSFFMMYLNSRVRANDMNYHNINEVMKFAEQRRDVEINTKKTAAAINKVLEKWLPVFSLLQTKGEQIKTILQMVVLLSDIKLSFLKHFQQLSNLSTFIKTTDGIRVTSHEGFVMFDGGGSVVKLVDRLEFSRNNFSKNVLHGWESMSR